LPKKLNDESMAGKFPYLNLGCGNRFIETWTNIDFVSNSPFVIQHDLNKGIPVDDNSIEVVYHSHILEHFMKDKGEQFIRECFRVLKREGIIRIAIPDLERLAKEYLNNLEKAIVDNCELNAENYNWSVIELFDQMVRNYSGGEMGKYWTKEKLLNEDHIIDRVGYEFKNFRKQYSNRIKDDSAEVIKLPKAKRSLINRIKARIKDALFSKPRGDAAYHKLGEFRSSGEIHQWMYDRYSLKVMLERNGFRNIKQMDAFTSAIPNWTEFKGLDVEKGQIRKPDSLFIEALK
jgi:predicted SAM-dependent methyltransferase